MNRRPPPLDRRACNYASAGRANPLPDRQKLIEGLDFLTDVLGNRVRSIAGVVLAFCWAFVVEGSQTASGGFITVQEVIAPIALD